MGTLTNVEDDRGEISNLHSQPLLTDADMGVPKADVAAVAARRINPHVEAVPLVAHLDADNSAGLLAGASLILDGCDNFGTRLAVNRAAVALRIPLLSAAIGAFEGQVAQIGRAHV